VSDGFHWSYITADGGRGKGELEGAKDPMGVLYVSYEDMSGEGASKRVRRRTWK
jgi:hypothetical protein